jgi:hypothetical protein
MHTKTAAPATPKKRKLSQQFNIRLSPAELRRLKRLASRNGFASASSLARHVLAVWCAAREEASTPVPYDASHEQAR